MGLFHTTQAEWFDKAGRPLLGAHEVDVGIDACDRDCALLLSLDRLVFGKKQWGFTLRVSQVRVLGKLNCVIVEDEKEEEEEEEETEEEESLPRTAAWCSEW